MASPRRLPAQVDTVIIGNGPSALLLSFILHGNIPHYNPLKPHPDPILRRKVLQSPKLLDIDVDDLTSHFTASPLSYSTQALPINVLLDTLLRPLADTNPGEYDSCVEWCHDASRQVSHVVLGNTSQPGGQWADNPIVGSWGVRALSYAEMLSLPGYSFEQHLKKTWGDKELRFYRPTRREVAEYMAAYPGMVKIAGSIFTNVKIDGISRTTNGFLISSHNVRCRRLVLASGVFSNLIPPRPLLKPLFDRLPRPPASKLPVLVIGSGFSAADVILSCPPDRRTIHIFKWNLDRPSPLQACHPRAYPEYASVYRCMKLAANNALGPQAVRSPLCLRRRKSNPFFERDWENVYEGLPNTMIQDVALCGDKATITLQGADGTVFEREISSLEHVIGRRGSLSYLDSTIQSEILAPSHQLPTSPGVESAETCSAVSIRTIRSKFNDNLEIAPSIFAIGSLTGDSLIRFAVGGCVFAAREIIGRSANNDGYSSEESTTPSTSNGSSPVIYPRRSESDEEREGGNNEYIITNGHEDLGVDRSRKTNNLSPSGAT